MDVYKSLPYINMLLLKSEFFVSYKWKEAKIKLKLHFNIRFKFQIYIIITKISAKFIYLNLDSQNIYNQMQYI